MKCDPIEILARFDEGGEAVSCGCRECMTALEAVMQEIAEKPADTANAVEVSASDEVMTVSAVWRQDLGKHEIHLYIGIDDWFYIV